jgi:hypothetical protein
VKMPLTPVNLQEFTPTAAGILQSAWKPPCLDYSREYLNWQFGFPTDLKPVAFAGHLDEKPMGFVAAIGRNTSVGPMYMSSFMSLVPGAPSSLAISIIRAQSRMLRDSGLATVVFAQIGSIGERLLAVGDTVGLKRFPLGEYRVHGAAPRSEPSGTEVLRVSPTEWLEVSGSLADPDVLSLAFDEPTLRHLEADPFGREFLIAKKDNVPVGSAMLSETRSISASGPQVQPTLHCVRLRGGDADALAALLFYAKRRGPVVSVPNAFSIPPETRRAAGLRANPAAFIGYISTATETRTFRGTDLEIV